MACGRNHAHLIVFAHACGYYSRAATISFVELHVRLLYSRVATNLGTASIRINTVHPSLVGKLIYTIYNEKYFSERQFSYNSLCHYMRAWIRVLDVPGCYEHVPQMERKFALQGSGLPFWSEL